MRIGRKLTGAAAALAVAAAVATVFPTPDALAKKRRRRGGALRLIDVNVGDASGIPLNEVIEFTFTSEVDESTVSHAIFQIRQENETRTGFTKQVPGSFQVQGRTVRFFPRLATHLRDLDSPTGAFYPAGSARDNADENAGLQPETNYEITVLGHPNTTQVRSTKGRRLNRSSSTRFTTAPITPRQYAYTVDTYQDAPPPGFQFSNPPDKVATVVDQYAKHGGTQEVPNDLAITLFGTKVPLQPSTVRKEGNIRLQRTERKGDPSQRKVMQGTTFLEQNFDTSRLFFTPTFPLPDLGTYALRVTKDVKDLTGQYDFRSNANRLRLRGIYEFLNTARDLSPGTPAEQLQDPPADLIFDWPIDAVSRSVLKRNVLELGDTYPDEIDPRVMVLFSTRDEPVSHGQVVVDFLSSDGFFDADNSTASWDGLVAGTTSAIMTIAAGSSADGDFNPAANETVNTDAFVGNVVNWRNVLIPNGIVVTITGSRPATLRGLTFQVEGEIRVDGFQGENASTGSYDSSLPPGYERRGGNGGPGGGDGGDAAENYLHSGLSSNGTRSHPNGGSDRWVIGNTAGASAYRGDSGAPGHDINLDVASADDGGRGGLGGTQPTSATYYTMGGGGGGGGARLAGGRGSNATAPYASWNGTGGNGGAGALAGDDLDPLVGGAGGAAGGHGTFAYSNYQWTHTAGAGGGGGGAIILQTASTLSIGTSGQVRSRGGRGGNGSGSSSTLSAGPGGGGGGGTVLLRSSKGFDFSDPTNATDVQGGPGGSHSGNYLASSGGTGGAGYVRTEDPNDGVQLPGGTTGFFEPVGGGVASAAWTKFINVGVDTPRIGNFAAEDISVNATNDALLIEMQMAIEDPALLDQPKLSALTVDGNTLNELEVSRWHPVRVVDNTGGGTPAIPGIPNYDPGVQGTDYTFDIAEKFNGFNYKFVRFRITFQLDDAHTPSDPLPNVDRLAMNFEFNF